MIVLKCYYDSVSKRLMTPIYFLLKGMMPFMAAKGSIISLILKW